MTKRMIEVALTFCITVLILPIIPFLFAAIIWAEGADEED